MSDSIVLANLDNGLILRHGKASDVDSLPSFYGKIFSSPEEGNNPWVENWTRDLLSRPHPTFQPADFTIVEETASGRIISAMNLINQTWAYDGIPFGVGRPELVATLPEFRRLGLVRKQFDIIHQWSAQRGHLLMGITGIPWYYRMFGYEMAVDLDEFPRLCPLYDVPALKNDESEPFRFRPATIQDIPFIAALYEENNIRRDRLVCLRDDSIWQYELNGRAEKNPYFMIMETLEGVPSGVLGCAWRFREVMPNTILSEVSKGISWLAAAPAMLRFLKSESERLAALENKSPVKLSFLLSKNHPLFRAAPCIKPKSNHTYAWFLRVPDLPGFMSHIAPAMERRLEGSIAEGHTGTLKISFYRSGISIDFTAGRVTHIESWRPQAGDKHDAAFPGLTFLQLLFGHRSLDELIDAFPDCYAFGSAHALLDVLFPKQPSNVWPVS